MFGFAAAYRLRGEYARLNFPRQQGDQGVQSGGSQQSSVDDGGVPPAASKSRGLTSTLDAKLQAITFQKNLQAQMAGGDSSHSPIEPVRQAPGKQPCQQASDGNVTNLCSPVAGTVDNHLIFLKSGYSTSASSPCQSPTDSSSASESRYVSSSSSSDATASVEDYHLRFDLTNDLSDDQLDMSWDVLLTDSGESCSTSSDIYYGSDGYDSPVGESVSSVTATKKRACSSSTLSPPRKYNVWRQCV